jgi:protein associated with RNAse G/E
VDELPILITVNSRNFDGTLRRSWKAKLISQDDRLIEMVGEFEFDVEHPDLGHIQRGTVSYEYYWLDRWYNVFRFHEATGEFRNYYCNINLPPIFENGILDYVDLDIDVLVDKDWQTKVLDVEEFEENVRRFSIREAICESAKNAVAELLSLIETRQFPFDHA